ncbi:alpha/beta hydrolase [soil metagenome]
MTDAQTIVEQWEKAGTRVPTPDGEVFVIDTPAVAPDGSPPLVVLHGYPSSSFDFRAALPALSANRRVVLFDQIGYGLSDKPDRRYGVHLQADTTQHVLAALELDRIDLLTHDMGDSAGGEILARDLDGTLGVEIRRRVVTNGSIYLDLAQLTVGQQLLSALPDEAMDHIDAEGMGRGLAATFSDQHPASQEELDAQWLLTSRQDGQRLLARLIRYLEDRRAEESRYTGAIETHPSPLAIVWGALDPIAVLPMTDRLVERRPDATLTVLGDVAHYPMVEVPERFAAAVLDGLGDPD